MNVLWPSFNLLSGLSPDLAGFVHVVLMDACTRELLYVNFTDEEGFRKTLKTGRIWCRTPRCAGLWCLTVDGQDTPIREIRVNASGETIVFLVERKPGGDRTFVGGSPVFYPLVCGLQRKNVRIGKQLLKSR